MIVIALHFVGIAAYLATAIVGRRMIDADPTPENAERVSRLGHAAFYLGVIVPFALSLVWPGGAAADRLTHLPSFGVPLPVRLAVAAILMVPAGYFGYASSAGLATSGKGAMAFKLTQHVVSEKAYAMVRNPMALGFYLGCLGASVLFGSTYLLAYTVLAVVPAQIFYLKFFEERELSVRYGASYDAYRARTPFLMPRIFSARH